MAANPKPEQMAALEFDIDLRLAQLWSCLTDNDDIERIGTLLRAAYGYGYVDALSEPNPGELCRTHGYRMPQRP